MTKESKKHLRERWKSGDFISSFPVNISYEMNIELLNDLDFRGITKISCGEPFWKFPNLYSAELKNIDFSFGNGAISISDCQINNFSFQDFKFDRSSHIYKSNIKNSTFSESKLILIISDTTFENCDFSRSKFIGGFNEYGFKRSKFINCNFTSALWKNTYIRACSFIDCNFENFKITNSFIVGFKVSKLNEEVKSMFENCHEVKGLIEIDNEKAQ